MAITKLIPSLSETIATKPFTDFDALASIDLTNITTGLGEMSTLDNNIESTCSRIQDSVVTTVGDLDLGNKLPCLLVIIG